MSKILSLLEQILTAVLEVKGLVNTSVIPSLNFISTPFLTYLNEDNMTNYYSKLGNIFGVTSLNKDILLNLDVDMDELQGRDLIGVFTSHLNNFYMISGAIAFLLIIVGIAIWSKREKKTPKERGILVAKKSGR